MRRIARRLKQLIRYPLYLSAYLTRDRKANGPVFVVGTGRSGTHMICRCVNKFPQVSDYYGGVESPEMFWSISNATVEQKSLSVFQLGYYAYMMRKVNGLFLDQTHPNLWNIEQLLEAFPKAKFLAIKRNVHSVSYSMKKHGGVSKWAKNHTLYPKPNGFLGVTLQNAKVYQEQLTDLQRDVFRWASHMERIDEVAARFPDNVRVIKYEDVGKSMKSVMVSLADFIGTQPPSDFLVFKEASLHKRDALTDDEMLQIDDALALWGLGIKG
ncbi:sulfotransferase family protein [Pseudidiomarina halophila]|uniref:Sulfotransferase domain-containing protein n=1 Tax=Pseudidiomarina halophila TaxID=1449799 RepID=A0A432XZ18_9GAMM|nr:sulfotransferase [Pseudidiomarina halophila]RUO53874.1 hypothetical protein CWI69_00065 [Pseudidiomarina halophila]